MTQDPTVKRRSEDVGSSEATPTGTDPEFVVAVDRAMKTIEMLADEDQGMTLSAIARNLGVNKQIAVRIVNTLAQSGYIFQTAGQTYKLTYKISNIGFRQQATARLADQCLPLIQGLAEETGELVRLAIVESGRPNWLHAAVGKLHRLRLDPASPQTVSYHAHAVGKVMLSTMSPKEAEVLLGSKPLEPLTSFTKTTAAEVLDDVALARARGYAASVEEAEVGVSAIAAPVMAGRPPRPVAVVSLAAPTSRVTPEALAALAPRLIAVCRQLADIWPLPLHT